MKINDKLGINPLVWGGVKWSEFSKSFKGKATNEKLKEVHKECIKIYKANEKPEA